MTDEEKNPVGEEEEMESCEPEEGCEEEAEVSGKGKKSGQAARSTRQAQETKPAAAPAPAKPAAATPAPAARYRYPFNIRYAAEVLDLTGFVDDQEYTDAQIRDLLIQNGYTEFADIEPAFHMSTNTNTLVITIKGSKKGGPGDGR